ncbi:hypothetical protein J3459_010932, partial [Metarhizium acridum]
MFRNTPRLLSHKRSLEYPSQHFSFDKRWFSPGSTFYWTCCTLSRLWTNRRRALNNTFDYWEVKAVEWPQYVLMALFSWFVVARVLIDASYRAATLVAVGLGGSSPEDWPPLFGSMWMAFTLRNFWGKFWHQFLRWPFTSTANYLTRDFLRLPRPSPMERYLNIFLVFLLSGLLHVMVDSVQGVLPSQSGAMTFFPLFTLGFMIEDGIQEAWKRLRVSKETHRADLRTTLWQRTLGFIWVITWMSLTSPPYLFASRQLSQENRELVPFSVVQVTGVYAEIIWILAGGVIVKVLFG